MSRKKAWYPVHTGRAVTPESIAAREKAIGPNPWGGYNHNSLGCEFFQMKSWDLAVREFQKAVEINPWEPRFKVNLARAYIAAGDIGNGEAMAVSALKQNPGAAGAMLALAMICEARADLRKAALWYRRCLAANPEVLVKSEAEENLAFALSRLKERKDKKRES